MKQILHKTTSILMALVVLFTTTSFTVDMHYCGDTLVDTAIFYKVKTCGMEMKKPSAKGCSITKKECCSDKQFVVDGQNELQLSAGKISFEKHVFIASFVYSYVTLFEGFDKEITTFQEYKPPLVKRELYKIDETYLI
jgi:hypothetical protein